MNLFIKPLTNWYFENSQKARKRLHERWRQFADENGAAFSLTSHPFQGPDFMANMQAKFSPAEFKAMSETMNDPSTKFACLDIQTGDRVVRIQEQAWFPNDALGYTAQAMVELVPREKFSVGIVKANAFLDGIAPITKMAFEHVPLFKDAMDAAKEPATNVVQKKEFGRFRASLSRNCLDLIDEKFQRELAARDNVSVVSATGDLDKPRTDFTNQVFIVGSVSTIGTSELISLIAIAKLLTERLHSAGLVE
jgi:hypothetical protein